MKKFYLTFLGILLFSILTVDAGVLPYTSERLELLTEKLQSEEQIKVFYNKNSLHITGLNDNATIEVYNMLGKKVASFQNIQVTENFTKSVSLPMNNIFIVSVQTENFKKTFKIVTK